MPAETRERFADSDPYAAPECAGSRHRRATLLDQLLYADTKTYLHELLMKQDQMSMAASIESRVPFLDHSSWSLPPRCRREMKLRGGTTKWILREAMKGILPAEILNRPKMGFPVPVGTWFRGDIQARRRRVRSGDRALGRGIFDAAFVRQLVAEHNAGVDHDERLWSLVNFEIWQRMFIDGEIEC